jgi:hypothetical protein
MWVTKRRREREREGGGQRRDLDKTIDEVNNGIKVKSSSH